MLTHAGIGGQEEKDHYNTGRTVVSSARGHLINSQDKGHGLMALNGVQPKTTSKCNVT